MIGALYLGFALLFFGYTITHGASRGRLIAGDALFYYAYLPSLLVDHDVDLTNDLETLRGGAPEPLKWQRTVTGKASSPFALGTAILAAPLVAVGIVLDGALGGRTDGYGWCAQGAMCLAGIVYSWLGALLLVRLLRRWFDAVTALVAALATILATPLVYYTLISPTYAHASSFFVVTAFLSTWLAVRERLTPRGALALGCTAGLMTLVRWQDVLFAIVPALALVSRLAARGTHNSERLEVMRFVALAALAAFVAFTPQMWVWHEIYGKWLTVPQGETWVRWTRPDIAAALVSLDAGGLFTWTPLTLFAVVGLASFRRREPLLAASLGLAFALQIYVEGTVHHGLGSAYGSRRLVGATAIFAIGFAALLDTLTAGRRRSVALALSAALVAWNGLLLVEYQWLVHTPGRRGPYPTLRELVSHTPFHR
ncbi:MAG: hypothetical protein IPK07_09085 [Deltaproteobacteria bacterium]|nr:hypothetical protein [Deltaproteobacteria bacterium]